jgi:uncharacterized protein (TIGR03086 family)
MAGERSDPRDPSGPNGPNGPSDSGGVRDLAVWVELDRRAVAASRVVAERLTGAGESVLDGPTPCAEWTVRALLEHLIAQHHGFARAAAGARDDVADWAPRPLGPDPVGEYAAAADAVTAAFAAFAAGTGDGCYLAEIRGGVTVPAELAVSFHQLDYVAHTWDLAEALGVDAAPLLDDAVVAAALDTARRLPTGDSRTAPGATFAPATAPAGDTPLAEFLALTGRGPGWR